MSTKQTEALKLALEALQVLGWQPTEEAMDYRDNAIDAIREALAEQPASKPWVGLTDKEIEQVCVPLGAAMLSFTEVARAIEAKLREKNNVF